MRPTKRNGWVDFLCMYIFSRVGSQSQSLIGCLPNDRLVGLFSSENAALTARGELATLHSVLLVFSFVFEMTS